MGRKTLRFWWYWAVCRIDVVTAAHLARAHPVRRKRYYDGEEIRFVWEIPLLVLPAAFRVKWRSRRLPDETE